MIADGKGMEMRDDCTVFKVILSTYEKGQTRSLRIFLRKYVSSSKCVVRILMVRKKNTHPLGGCFKRCQEKLTSS